jgi:hypothetical protein
VLVHVVGQDVEEMFLEQLLIFDAFISPGTGKGDSDLGEEISVNVHLDTDTKHKYQGGHINNRVESYRSTRG